MVPQELYAKAGDKILVKFNALLAWIKSQRIIANERIKVVETAHGMQVYVEDKPQIIEYPLRITILGDEEYFTVGEGYVNMGSPDFYDWDDGKYRQVDPFMTKVGKTARIPDHVPEEAVYFFVVVRFRSAGFKMEQFSVVQYCVEAVNTPELRARDISIKDLSMGIPYRNTGLAEMADCRGEFYVPLAVLKNGTLNQFNRHHVMTRVYLDGERKRMTYWAA